MSFTSSDFTLQLRRTRSAEYKGCCTYIIQCFTKTVFTKVLRKSSDWFRQILNIWTSSLYHKSCLAVLTSRQTSRLHHLIISVAQLCSCLDNNHPVLYQLLSSAHLRQKTSKHHCYIISVAQPCTHWDSNLDV